MTGERVRITDVSPRDGLQNEPGVIPTAEKVELVRLLCETGVDEVEVTSFVSPKWVPQLGDGAEVFLALGRLFRHEGCGERNGVWSALVPNERGMHAALAVNDTAGTQLVDAVSVFTAASETFSRRNTNASIAGAIERFKPVKQMALGRNMPVRGYVSCAIACPFEGPQAPERVLDISRQLVVIGVDEIDLADTIGAGTVESMRALLGAFQRGQGSFWEFCAVRPGARAPRLTLHLHDTFGRAAECVKVALDMGVRSFDGAVSGLGGCPYASTPGRRAPGNISTQTLVRTIHDAGYTTGVDLDKLELAGRFATKIVSDARARAASGGDA
ncbi:MAG: hydroxymethylglutaryl-CoA lyase [Phycisphaerales bacterium]